MYEAPSIIGTCINCVSSGSLAATFAVIAIGIALAVRFERQKLKPVRVVARKTPPAAYDR
jgi:hypothetical protein